MKKLTVGIGFLISAFFLYLVFRKMDLHELSMELSAANFWYLIPASILTLIALWVRAVRWGVILHPVQRIPQGPLFSSTAIGFLGNNVLPMRLGELVRAYMIRRTAGVRASAAMATILVERLFDLFTMIGIFGLLLFVAPFDNRSFKISALFAFCAGIIALLGLIAFYKFPDPFEKMLNRLLPRFAREKILSMLRSFGSGLEILSDRKRLIQAGILTVVMWLMIAVVIKMCFSAAGLQNDGTVLPATSSLVVLVVMAIGVMIPSGPGFIGTLQAAAVLGLAIVGYTDRSRALSFSILYHITQWVPVVAAGMICLLKENLSLLEVGRLSREEDLDP